MPIFSLRKSAVDPEFFEVICEGAIVDEIKVPFTIRSLPSSFSSLEEIFVWLEKTEKRLAKNFAYCLLARKGYSQSALKKKLEMKKYSPRVSETIINELAELGYLSDESLAEAIVLQKLRQGYGPAYIRLYLQKKGLSPDLAREMIDEKAQIQAMKKWETKLKGKSREMKIAFLLRKGFDFSVLRCT